jgi:CRISPR/Cas system-associated endonuclease/helicase Cas3
MGIPMLMKIHLIENNQKKAKLTIPLIIVWILLLPILVIALPFVLLAAIITWPTGYGKIILSIIPMFLRVLSALPGLHIQVESPKNKTLLLFK